MAQIIDRNRKSKLIYKAKVEKQKVLLCIIIQGHFLNLNIFVI
jgi:hypothetical protein